MSEQEEPPPSTEDEVRKDARELNRGVMVNLLGYLLKAAHPVLLVAVVRLYGAERFGVFTVVQAASIFALRGVLMGMDKAVLWWVPRQDPQRERLGLPAVFATAGGLAAGVSVLAVAFGRPWMERWSGPDAAAAMQIMILALAPMALMELLIHAVLGKRQMGARVVARETIVPLTQVGGGVALHMLGFEEHGLAIAYVLSYLLGLLAALYFFRRAFAGSAFVDGPWPLQREMVRFGLPAWLTEVVNTFSMRMDVYALAALSEASTVGIYAAVTQIGNALRAIRQSFDPIVVALFSQISARADATRLRAGFSRATATVVVTQMPVYAFLFAFTVWLMPLFGPGFERGTDAVLVLAGAAVVNGLLGMHGLVLIGFGRSDLMLYITIAGVAVQAVLLYVLIPPLGVTGAALAVGLNMTFQNLAQWWQANGVSGINPYNRWVAQAMGGGTLAAVAMAGVWLALAGVDERVQRVAAFLAFVAVGGAFLWRVRGRTRRQRATA